MAAEVLTGPWAEKDAPETITQGWAAKSFAAAYKGKLAWCKDSGRWYIWSGHLWTLKVRPSVFYLVHAHCTALSAGDPPPKNRAKMQNADFARAVEYICQRDPDFAKGAADWDNNIWLLGTPGGTVDLLTGELCDSDHEDGITKSTAVPPVDIAHCPMWLNFLKEATRDDPALIRYLQQICGYALTGDISEQMMWFIYGPGGRGKGVFANTIQAIMGDYAVTAAASVLEKQKNAQHSTDLAMMAGARIVLANETEEGAAWDEPRIKTLTGGDRITARFMARDNFTFLPQFSLWVVGNFAPTLRTVDDAMRRRFNIIPFTVRPRVKDTRLVQKLRSEYPSILRWMIDGCVDWRQNGFMRPEIVAEETDKYFADQDALSEWLSLSCDLELDNPYWLTKSDTLYASWKAFAQRQGVPIGSSKTFRPKLEQMGILSRRMADGVWFTGVKMRGLESPFGSD